MRSNSGDRTAFVEWSRGSAIRLTAACVVALVAATAAPAIAAAVDYEHVGEYDTPNLGFPTGLAVDQRSDDLYVANLVSFANPGLRGSMQRVDTGEAGGGNAVFGDGYFPAAAVDPEDGDVYTIDFGNETEMLLLGNPFYVWDPFGHDRRIVTYDASGNLKAKPSIPITADLLVPVRPQLATDRSGDIYYPNVATDRIEIYKRNGKLARTITGSANDGSLLRNPSQVAIGPHDSIFVVDGVKMVDDGTDYLVTDFSDARLQQFNRHGHRVGTGPVVDGRVKSVGVHPKTGRVFVGRAGIYAEGDPDAYYDPDYHIEAYDSGVEVADFGHGYYSHSAAGPGIAVSGETGEVYVSDEGSYQVEVYARTYD